MSRFVGGIRLAHVLGNPQTETVGVRSESVSALEAALRQNPALEEVLRAIDPVRIRPHLGSIIRLPGTLQPPVISFPPIQPPAPPTRPPTPDKPASRLQVLLASIPRAEEGSRITSE